MVDGSNESLYHADEEIHPLVRTFSPLQTIFQNLDVFVSIALVCNIKVNYVTLKLKKFRVQIKSQSLSQSRLRLANPDVALGHFLIWWNFSL